MPALCKCGSLREKRVAGPNSKFPGREYFKCEGQGCGTFEWADDRPQKLFSSEVGPICRCDKASVQRTVRKEGPNKGRKFWACATYPGGCRFFEFQDVAPASPRASISPVSPKTPVKKRPPLPGWANYLTDWKQMEMLQKMMKVDKNKVCSIEYDSLEVVGAWRITNKLRKESYDKAKKRVASPGSPVELPEEYTNAMRHLGGDPLDGSSGEVFLLHGTAPNKLHNILFEGLDPDEAANGLFGRGTYFAEDAAKIDQYARVDHRYGGELSELHEKIYGSNRHPTRVRYALVCRVLLGRPIATKDGKKQIMSGGPLFKSDHRTSLAPFTDGPTPDSLIAEVKETKGFREFVIFCQDQIFVEFLVAYHRVRSFCDCGLPVKERTAVQGENRGRKLCMCPWDKGDSKNCGFIQMFPLCDCGYSAKIKTSHSEKNPNRQYYCCGKFRKSCNYFSWTNTSQSQNPYKRQRN